MGNSEHTERVRRLWQRAAPSYDRQMRVVEKLHFGGGRAWVCSQAGGDTLEVAIGTGRNLEFYPPGTPLTGIDLSAAMLDIARTHAADLGREVELIDGDAQALPFEDSSFDTVVCTLSLCNIPDDRAAIAEMHRVLRPSGRVLLLEHIGSHYRLLWLAQRLLEKATVRMLGDYHTRRPLLLVEQAGFVVRQQERLKAGTVERVAAVKPTGR
jgi:ubiquinone/menaquinone biosynthesis C-methylase UbiE